MIDYTSVEGKAGLECYTLEDFLQETLELGTKGYKLCLENDYFCFNRGGNYTAYFDAPAVPSSYELDDGPLTDDEIQAIREANPDLNGGASENVIKLSAVDSEAFVAALLGELTPEEVDNTPSDVNTAATPDASTAQDQDKTKEEAPVATPRRGRPPRATT